MSEWVAGGGIVAAFIVFAALMVARKLPALLAVPLLAVAIAAIAGVPPAGLGDVVSKGAGALAGAYTTVIFGALLSRVVMQTGIAETIVHYAAEFGGERPLTLALVLCAAVATLFTSQTGLGAIIMVGTIVLPVMMTSGVPRSTAATLFLLSFALGFVLNIAQWKFYHELFGIDQAQLQTFAEVLFAIDAVALLVYAFIRSRTTRDYATWATAAPAIAPRLRAKPWALVAPVLPLVLFVGFRIEAIVAFALSAVYAALVTSPRAAIRVLVAAWIRGLEDVAPAVILFMGIGMLLVAAKTPQVAAAIEPIVAALAPRTPLAYVILFGILSPLALYRGPLNPFGVGIGVYAVLASLHALPPIALVAAVMAVVQVQNVCDPTNTQNVWVANFTGVRVDRITRLTLPYQVAVATAATVCVVIFGARLFPGAHVFSFSVPAVSAAELSPGMFAPLAASRTIAVRDDGSPDGKIVADQIAASVAEGWAGFRSIRTSDDPSATDCAQRRYASMFAVSVERLPGTSDVQTDVGLELLDCAGWSVTEWHVPFSSSGAPVADALRANARLVLFRVRTWEYESPGYAAEVFERGLAYDVSHATPTYFYTLFKTADGYMRALVRPGGPAYLAGMRTNDVVDKVDGRFWWEYGTYQTQLRAYDGKPHAFEITRGDRHGIVVTLGEPFSLAASPPSVTGQASEFGNAIAWAQAVR